MIPFESWGNFSLVREAQVGGYAGDVEALRSALRARLSVIREVDAEVGDALLRDIAKAGGINSFDMLAHLLSPADRQDHSPHPLIQILLMHFQSINKTQEDDERLKEILSTARDVTRRDRQMTDDQKTSWLATLDQVERELLPAWLPFDGLVMGSDSHRVLEDRDGSSPTHAIVVRSVADECEWLARHFPGYTLGFQKLMRVEGKHFDVLNVYSEAGGVRDVYFEPATLREIGAFLEEKGEGDCAADGQRDSGRADRAETGATGMATKPLCERCGKETATQPLGRQQWLTAQPKAERFIVHTAFNVRNVGNRPDPALCLTCLREVITLGLTALRGEQVDQNPSDESAPNAGGREDTSPGDLRHGPARTVTLDELHALAEKKGTSLEVQRGRALAAGYTVEPEDGTTLQTTGMWTTPDGTMSNTKCRLEIRADELIGALSTLAAAEKKGRTVRLTLRDGELEFERGNTRVRVPARGTWPVPAVTDGTRFIRDLLSRRKVIPESIVLVGTRSDVFFGPYSVPCSWASRDGVGSDGSTEYRSKP